MLYTLRCELLLETLPVSIDTQRRGTTPFSMVTGVLLVSGDHRRANFAILERIRGISAVLFADQGGKRARRAETPGDVGRALKSELDGGEHAKGKRDMDHLAGNPHRLR